MLTLASGLCLFTLGVHLFAGQRFVVTELASGTLDPFARATLFVVWHMVTWTLLACAGVLFLGQRPLALLAGTLCAGYALLFVVVAQRTFRAAIRLPQWILLGPVALFAFAGALGKEREAVAALLSAVALVHAAWALGVSWPAGDAKSLALATIGRRQMPSRLACATVALVLVGMAAVVISPAPLWAQRSVAAVFVVRGTFGLAEPWLRRTIRGTPYARYSAFMYTPLALAIGVAVLVVP